ncbi:MAG: anaerobic ribonucleoside-triphosphate reductase activating protein [Promethearchaeia archaeon]
MRIGGFIDISTKDIPHRATMVIFTVGCNYKCGYCHNKHLLNPDAGQDYSITQIIKRVTSNRLVSGVSVTGGEPTLQKDIIEACKELSQLDKYVSVDSNGSRPEVLKSLLPYLNRVALDVKGPYKSESLREITNANIDPAILKKSFSLINREKTIDFEIRTTYEPNLLQQEDIHEILDFLQDKKFRGKFVLQQYQYNEGVQEKFEDIYEKPPHYGLVKILEPYARKNLNFEIYLRDEAVGYEHINKSINKFEDLN